MLDLGFRPKFCLVFLALHGGSQHGLLAFRKKKLLRSIVRSVQGDYIWGDVLKGRSGFCNCLDCFLKIDNQGMWQFFFSFFLGARPIAQRVTARVASLQDKETA